MATFQDAQAGWEIFQSSDNALSLNDINSDLVRLGFAPVSPRTYAHYNKLVRYGYENYIPINQLDVKTLEDPVWDIALRNRYFTWETQLPVRLSLLTPDGPHSIRGVANRISEANASIRLDKRSKAGPELFRKHHPLFIEFLDQGERRFAEVESVTQRLHTGITTLGVFFPTNSPVEPVLRRTPLTTSPFRITVIPQEQERYFTRVVQQIYWLFQTIESTRLIAEEVLRALDSESEFSISSPRVTTLVVASPLEVVFGIAAAVGFAVDATVGRYLKHRKTFWEGSKLAAETKALQWENERKKGLGAISTDELTHKIAEQLAESLAKRGKRVSPDLSAMDVEKVDSLNRKQLQKSVAELADSSADIQVQPENEETA